MAGSAQDVDAAALAALGRVAGSARGQAGAENFPVALRLLPAGPRTRLLALYDFARFVDDVGDARFDLAGRAVTPTDRLRLLDVVAADLDDPAPRLAPVRGLAPLLAAGVPVAPFHDLVAANRQDQQVTAYADFDALVAYCRLSADPVGRVVLHVAGAHTPQRERWSDDVCTALQVLEHCQDVAEDAAAGRVYLPQDDLAGADLRTAVALNVGRSQTLLRSGRPLVRSLSGWARVAVAGFVAGGLATADALLAADFRTDGPTVRPRAGRTVRHALLLAVGA